MIHFDYLTVDNTRLKVGIDMDSSDKHLYVEFNVLMDLFNFTMMDKTVDDVTVALMGTSYRSHIYIDEVTEVFEDKKDYCSKELWVDVECLKFLRDESVAPFMMDEIVNFIEQNEKELKEELLNGLSNDGYSS